MTDRQADWVIRAFCLFTAALLAIILFACNPVKQAAKRQERLNNAVLEYLRRNPPKADTFYLPGDTVYHTDTIVNENIYLDTVWVNDTVFITKTKWREYVKTAYIRDTIVRRVSDCSEYSNVKDQNLLLTDRLAAAKRKANGYMWALFGLISLIICYIMLKILK